MNYCPEIFNVADIDHAKAIILNNDGTRTPEERWVIETPYLLNLMSQWMPLQGATVLDFGCGIGRVSKALVEEHGCAALGVDISTSMRGLAVSHVNSPNFLAVDPSLLPILCRLGVQFDCAVAVWVLQHVLDLASELAMIKACLKPRGRMFVLNAQQRFVPAAEGGRFGWADDGVDLWEMLNTQFATLRVEPVDPKIVPNPPSFWGVFEKGVS